MVLDWIIDSPGYLGRKTWNVAISLSLLDNRASHSPFICPLEMAVIGYISPYWYAYIPLARTHTNRHFHETFAIAIPNLTKTLPNGAKFHWVKRRNGKKSLQFPRLWSFSFWWLSWDHPWCRFSIYSVGVVAHLLRCKRKVLKLHCNTIQVVQRKSI